MRSWVGIEIVQRNTGDRREVVFGEFPAAYERGITIGGFADCSEQIEHSSTKDLRARISAVSNHRYIEILSAPVSSSLLSADVRNPRRIDFDPFEFGAFTIRVVEVSLGDVIQSLSVRDERFSRAIDHLKPFGLFGRPAVPRLLAKLLDTQHNVQSECVEALQRLGVVVSPITPSEVLRRLREFATDSDFLVSQEAIPVCMELNEIEAVWEGLADSSLHVRVLAAKLLWRQTRQTDKIVDVLIEALRIALSDGGESFYVVGTVSVILGEMGESARPAIPLLASAARMQVARGSAVGALTRIDSAEAARLLIEGLDDESLYTRRDACGALGNLPLHANIVVPALIRQLDVELNNAVCLWAVQALAKFGAASSAAVPVVRRTRERFSRLPSSESPEYLVREADRCLAAITSQSAPSSDNEGT